MLVENGGKRSVSGSPVQGIKLSFWSPQSVSRLSGFTFVHFLVRLSQCDFVCVNKEKETLSEKVTIKSSNHHDALLFHTAVTLLC